MAIRIGSLGECLQGVAANCQAGAIAEIVFRRLTQINTIIVIYFTNINSMHELSPWPILPTRNRKHGREGRIGPAALTDRQRPRALCIRGGGL